MKDIMLVSGQYDFQKHSRVKHGNTVFVVNRDSIPVLEERKRRDAKLKRDIKVLFAMLIGIAAMVIKL